MKRAAALVVVFAAASYAILCLSPTAEIVFRDHGLFRGDVPASLGGLDFALDRALAGASPRWLHVRSVLWHALAALLLLGLLRRWGATVIGATLGALVFALHPAAVGTVALAASRGELLGVVLVLGALGTHRRSKGADRWFGATLGLAALAVAASAGAAAFAALALLADGVFRDGRRWKETLRRWPFYAAHASVAVLVLGVRLLPAGGASPAASAVEAGSLLARGVALGVRTVLFPVDPAAGYSVPPGAGADAVTIGCAVAALAIATLAVRGLKGRAAATSFGVLWFLVTLLAGEAWAVATAAPIGEPLFYLPLVGPAIAVAGTASRPFPGRGPARLAAGVLLLCLLALTVTRTRAWLSDAALFGAARVETPAALEWRAELRADRGRELLARAGDAKRGDPAASVDDLTSRGIDLLREASGLYDRAARLRAAARISGEEGIRARARRALVHLDLGYHQLALQEADRVLADPSTPGRSTFLRVRARALRQMGDARAAAWAIEKALALDDSPEVKAEASAIYADLAHWYVEMAGTRDGLAYLALRRCWELLPSREENAAVRKALDSREQEYAERRAILTADTRARPGSPEPVLAMAVLEGRRGRFEKARTLFERLLGRPELANDPRILYGYALYGFEGTDTLDGYDRAEEIYQGLLRRDPGSKALRTAIARVTGYRALLRASLAQ